MRRLGYKIEFEPRAMAWTEEPPSIKSFVRQRTRWTRGIQRTTKKYPYKSFRSFLSDTTHGIYFYTSPFLIMTITALMILLLLKMDLIFISPMIAIFIFNMYLLVKSRLFYKESLKDLLLLPVFFVLGNITPIVMLKSWYDERTNKEMHWFKSERTGLVLR
jgi:cellulose synthase/poly-beta-1,6-N-acetylglucosamine synthase-like glycosyltransferase